MKRKILFLLMTILSSTLMKAAIYISGEYSDIMQYQAYEYWISNYKSGEVVANSFTWKIKNGKIWDASTDKFNLDSLNVDHINNRSHIYVIWTSDNGGALELYANTSRGSNLFLNFPITTWPADDEMNNEVFSTPMSSSEYLGVSTWIHDCVVNNGGGLRIWATKSIRITPPFEAYEGSTVRLLAKMETSALADTAYSDTVIAPESLKKMVLSRWVDPQETISSSVTELGSPSLGTNTPNPFTESSVISCYIPKLANSAQIFIFDVAGNAIKKINLADRGNISITINASDFSKGGTYCYALLLNGKFAGSKKMQVIK